MVDIDWLMSGVFFCTLFVEFVEMISSFVYIHGGTKLVLFYFRLSRVC